MNSYKSFFHILAMKGGLLSNGLALLEQIAGSGKAGNPRDPFGRRTARIQKPFAAAKVTDHANSHK
jgi:hypothetical protein